MTDVRAEPLSAPEPEEAPASVGGLEPDSNASSLSGVDGLRHDQPPVEESATRWDGQLRFRRSRNIRAHSLRHLVRISVLLGSDVLVFIGLRGLVRFLRDGALGGTAARILVEWFPPGFLGSWHFLFALVLGLAIAGAYGTGDARRDAGRVLLGVALAALLSNYGAIWSSSLIAAFVRSAGVIVVFGAGLGTSRLIVDGLAWVHRPSISMSRTVVVAHDDTDWATLSEMFRRAKDFIVVGRVTLGRRLSAGLDPNLRQLGATISALHADTVFLWGRLTEDAFAHAVDAAVVSGCRVMAGGQNAIEGIEPRGTRVGGQQVVEMTPAVLRGSQRVLKRGLDLAGAVLGLLVVGPIMAVVAVLIKLDSRGPVLFAQDRLGAGGRPFHCYKFRSMRADAEERLRANPVLYRKYIDNHFKLPEEEDPRLTRLGRLLRKTSLDELPQLLNVLLGQMSLVGPRPIVPAELDYYGGRVAQLFLSLKPGMTGAWAVNGRSSVGYPSRALMELEYIRRWSLFEDLRILLRTVPAVATGRGAH